MAGGRARPHELRPAAEGGGQGRPQLLDSLGGVRVEEQLSHLRGLGCGFHWGVVP